MQRRKCSGSTTDEVQRKRNGGSAGNVDAKGWEWEWEWRSLHPHASQVVLYNCARAWRLRESCGDASCDSQCVLVLFWLLWMLTTFLNGGFGCILFPLHFNISHSLSVA